MTPKTYIINDSNCAKDISKRGQKSLAAIIVKMSDISTGRAIEFLGGFQ